ncbi:flippase-like domain-containing protein [Candidatus Saccharibacteria bacterium]|nr:flippase-like domain-containing protein [Candidatus Saccharibacteria bacterium]
MQKQFSKFIRRRIQMTKKSFISQRRDARYVFVFVISFIVFVLSCLQALDKGLFDSVERPIFDTINNLPTGLDGVMYGLTQFGGMGSLFLWLGAAWFLINKRAAWIVAGSGIVAWFIAKSAKVLVARGRPEDLLETVRLFGDEKFGGYGFPSGHASFAAACVTILYFQVDRKYRKYLLGTVFLVGVSRMYLGAHFPLDIVGGWALGALIAAVFSLVFGISRKDITVNQIKSALLKKGYPMKTLKFADVDARGSRPVFMTDSKGKRYFAKIFGVQEHAADWLFKIYRFFRFKNFQAEEPYINSRRNIEMESFATLWAKQAGIRVPSIIDLLKIRGSWMLIQDRLDAVPMSEHGNIRQKTLIDAWRQVDKLHNANMAHRDLRAANLMIDKAGKAWVIDFGFAEVSPRKQRQYMDVAELLMSMTLLVGVKRTVKAATAIVDDDKLIRALPYLKREVFSGATSKSLKSQKHLLDELKNELVGVLNIKVDIDEADIIRFNKRKILNLALIGIFVYVIIPQINAFKGAFESLTTVNWVWLLPIGVASIVTYVLTGLVYVILSSVPLKLFPTALVQLAASFISKIVPGGIGNTSLNIRYLRKAGMDVVDASAVLVTNNIISFVMFIVPLGLFLLFDGQSLSGLLSFDITAKQVFLAVCVVLALFIFLTVNKHARKKAQSAVSNFITSLREFTNSPLEVSLASATSLTVSLSYILCLYACFKAFGIPLGLSGAILVYVSAIIAKSVAPTPGGLGPFELAMISAMVSLGTSKPEALSVVVLYRLATFWLPIPFSLLAYQYISRKKLI